MARSLPVTLGMLGVGALFVASGFTGKSMVEVLHGDLGNKTNPAASPNTSTVYEAGTAPNTSTVYEAGAASTGTTDIAAEYGLGGGGEYAPTPSEAAAGSTNGSGPTFSAQLKNEIIQLDKELAPYNKHLSTNTLRRLLKGETTVSAVRRELGLGGKTSPVRILS
jgi:hypothetical protein